MKTSLSSRAVRPLGVAALTLLGGLYAADANAQQYTSQVTGGFSMNRFEPSERGSEWFSQDSLDLRGDMRPAIGVTGDLSYRPQRLSQDAYGSIQSNQLQLVSAQGYVHLGGSLVLFDRLRVGLELPIAVAEDGNDIVRNGIKYNAPSGGGIGDPRLTLDVRLTGAYGDAFTAAIGATVWAPLGDKNKFLGDGDARFQPHFRIAGDIGSIAYAANIGYLLRGNHIVFADKQIGDELQFGAAIGLRLDDKHLLIGPEIFGGTGTTGSGSFFGQYTSYVEGTIGIHYSFDDWRVGVGAGPGLTSGVGTPTFRSLLTFEWVPGLTKPVIDRDHDGIVDDRDACLDVYGVASTDPTKNGCPLSGDRDGDGIPDDKDACVDTMGVTSTDATKNGCPLDRDGDGIADAVDACPDVKGVKSDDPKKNGCPSDRDGDGITDDKDACPDVAGVASTDATKNGCSPDRDGDGIADAVDACPDVKGVKSDDPKKNGCPSDRDGDGIIDDEDACPDSAGPKDPDPKKNGCPLVRVEKGQVRITEQIRFKTGSAEILKESMPIVEAVAKALKEVPEIKKLRVEGHTDNKGSPAGNKDLSRRRAAAVVQALIKLGVDKGRLESAGYGQEKPIEDNATETGRTNNRRVEFRIVDGPGAEAAGAMTITTTEKKAETAEKKAPAASTKPAPAPAPKK
ncbi:MAG: OmpA family protein [Polyangiales bacterium]